MRDRRGHPEYLGYGLTGLESVENNEGQFNLEKKSNVLFPSNKSPKIYKNKSKTPKRQNIVECLKKNSC